jgi:hypothetical protein
MLGGPDEILPPNAIVPLNGTAELVRQAFERAREAVDRGEPYRNPLEDGEIVIPPHGGPFGFIPGPHIMGQAVEVGQAVEAGQGEQLQHPSQNVVQIEAFPRNDLTFDLSDLMALPDLNEGIADLPPNALPTADTGEQLAGSLTAALQQPVILIESDDDTPARRSPRRRQPEEPPAKKTTVTVTYERRRSERLKVKLDGVRVDSVKRATERKASSTGESDSSTSSATARRRKTRLLPDINKAAPLPITVCPPENDMGKLEELATCCGFTLIEVEHALKNQKQSKDGQGTSKHNE